MRALLQELENPKILAAFPDKALFDGGKADHLGGGSVEVSKEDEHVHVFHQDDVANALQYDVRIHNSKAGRANRVDDQKSHSAMQCKNIGEIEDRHDSVKHCRGMKFRLNSESEILQMCAKTRKTLSPQIAAYGRAARIFELPSEPSTGKQALFIASASEADKPLVEGADAHRKRGGKQSDILQALRSLRRKE